MAGASRRRPEDSTARLDLYRPTVDDVAALFAICGDPRVWSHYPSLRHTRPERTAATVRQWVSDWRAHGLGVWVTRTRDDGAVIGYGGCSVKNYSDGSAVWNLGYRLAVAAHGRGLATELSRRAIVRANVAAAELPVIAYLVEHNVASAAVARKLGLTLVHRGPDTGNPDPGAVRLVYADRPLHPNQLAAVTR